jgi:hypothetical protein
MNIEKIGSLSLLSDNTFFKLVKNSPKSSAASSKTYRSRQAESEKEIVPHFSEAAVHLQKMDQQLDQIEKTAGSVREELTAMRRTLPPFPPGSEERVRILKGYVGLRKLIEELTIPPEVNSEKIKEEITIPKLSDQATDQEVDAVILALDKKMETIQQKRVSLIIE